MEASPTHESLDIRLNDLAHRIDALKRKRSLESDADRALGRGELHALERRYDALLEKLRKLNSEGPGFRQDVRAEIAAMADDMFGWVDEHMQWIESGYQEDKRPVTGGRLAM